MREVGVRELKSHLSQILRAVDHGESIRITHRGRPIAELAPPAVLTEAEHIHMLVRQGKLIAATKPHSPPPTPLRPLAGRSATQIVLDDRDSER